jgi:LacI family transcriptional regulator
MSKNTTIRLKDIAEIAGVSIPVVSVALSRRTNSTTKLTKETAERIQKIAAELNYKPDIFGRSLRANKSFLVGIMLYSVNSTIIGDFIRGVQKSFAKSGYSPIFLTHANRDEQRRNLELCVERKVDGLILNAWIDEESEETDNDFIKNLIPDRVPIIEVFGHNLPDTVTLNIDMKNATYNMCSHLLDSGYKKILMINHEKYKLGSESGIFLDAWESFNGYQKAMLDHGLPARILTHPLVKEDTYINWSENTYNLISMILEKNELPEAIICMNDEQAYGILKACAEHNISIPKDLALCCVYDSRVCQFSIPSLTACSVLTYDFGITASEMLFKVIEKKSVVSKKTKTKLVVRESSR